MNHTLKIVALVAVVALWSGGCFGGGCLATWGVMSGSSTPEAASVSMPPATPGGKATDAKILQARQIEVVDEKGNVQILLRATNGRPVAIVSNEQGNGGIEMDLRAMARLVKKYADNR